MSDKAAADNTELLESFAEEARRRCDVIAAGLATATTDFETMRAEAHALRGTAGVVGLRRLAGAEEAPRRALEALAAVGLSDAAAAHPAELPSSLQRLLALATVLARRPALLALDEPTVGLDRHGLTHKKRPPTPASKSVLM